MRRLLLLFFLLFSLNFAKAQLANGSIAPDWTLTDINGITHNLYNYLDNGYTVFIDFSAVWCSPCWAYHNSGALEDLYINHGPAGMPNVSSVTTNDVMVFYIEGDQNTVASLSGIGGNTQGDWITGTPYPIICTDGTVNNNSVSSDYSIGYFPTIYMVCPDRLITEAGQSSNPYNLVSVCPSTAIHSNDVKILSYDESTPFCNDLSPEITIQNYGLSVLTSLIIDVSVNGAVVSSTPWVGNLTTYDVQNVTLPVISGLSNNDLITVTVSQPNGFADADPSNNSVGFNVNFIDNANTNVTISITTDQYPAETTWDIVNSSGQIVASGGPYSLSLTPQTPINVTLSADECYNFSIYDTFGDGICCAWGQGSYTLTDGNGTVLASGGQFTDVESTIFKTTVGNYGCTDPTANNYDPTATINDGSCIYNNSTLIWSEDFVNGIPSTWSNSTAPWVYRGPTTNPSQNTGTQGAYGTASTTISSPTQTNGFIIFDSDYYDNNGTQGNFGNGPYPAPHMGELMTGMIDLTAYSDVTLMAHSYFRTFMGQAFVAFYVNGVYDSQVQVHSDLSINEATTTDATALVRLPSSVCGNANVQMKFIFDGVTQSNVNGSGYYFWMLDDLKLIRTPNNSIQIEDVVLGGFWIDYLNYSGAANNEIYGLDYSVTPLSQVANHPYAIEGVLRNIGSANQNSRLNYEVSGSGSYTGSSALTSIPANSAGTVDSVLLGATPLLSPQIGTYNIAIWGISDSAGVITTSSDTVNKEIEISDYIYAKDLGESNLNGSWTIGSPSVQNHITTRYEMYANEQLYSLRAYITNESVVGAQVKAVIYESDYTASNGLVYLNESDYYTITSSDLGSWVDIPFLSPVQLYNGYSYEFGIAGVQHPTDSAVIGTSGEALYNGEHLLYDELGFFSQSSGTPTWYYIESTPMLRMNFDPVVYGCTDPTACNYNSVANINDGSCVGLLGCIDPNASNYNPSATCDDGSCIYSNSSCSNLFISEYVEGPGNNNAIEIYNPRNTSINLSGYSINRYGNGSTIPTSVWPLSGTIAAGQAFTIGNGQVDSVWVNTYWSLPVDAAFFSMLDDHCNGDYNANSTFYFNGDDAITLEYNGNTVDIFGKVGEDPGGAWTDDASAGYTDANGGTWWTKRQTLIRKPSVTEGVTQNPILFNPTLEYDSLPDATYSNLGSHNCNCNAGVVYGCTDPIATNYNPVATIDDGSCSYSTSCTPDPQYTIAGIYPDPTTGLALGYVGQSYNDVITIIVPLDTPIILLGQSVPVDIDSIVLNSVTGLPSGFSYVCNPSNCSFAGGSIGCVSIFSTTAPTSLDTGLYNLDFEIISYASNVPFVGTLQQTDIISDYYIEILDSTSFGCTDPTADNYDPTATIDNGSCIYCSSLFVSDYSTNVSCSPDNWGNSTDGSIDITVFGGTPPYSYSWVVSNGGSLGSNLSTDEDLVYLSPGTYTYTVIDINGCEFTDSVTIISPDPISGFSSNTNVICNGDSTGAIDITVVGGTLPYTYFWDMMYANGGYDSSTSEDLFGLTAGFYTCTITDGNGCWEENVVAVTITEPLAISVLENIDDVSCFGGSDGIATVYVSGGTGSVYTYNWFGMNPNALPAGLHNYSVTDNNGCVYLDDVTISEPSPISLTLNTIDASCVGTCDGMVAATPSGGTQPYIFEWQDASGNIISQNNFISNLCAGFYTCEVTDFNGCIYTQSFVMSSPNLLTPTFTPVGPYCEGDTIPLLPTTSTNGISGTWSPAIDNTTTTTYTFTPDTGQCASTTVITIIINSTVTPIITYSDESTPGACDASATALISGGCPPYTYSWSNGQSTQSITSLCAGTYCIDITSCNGCITQECFNIGNLISGCTDPTAFNYDSTATVDDGSCIYCDLDASFILNDVICEWDNSNWAIDLSTSSAQIVNWTWVITYNNGFNSDTLASTNSPYIPFVDWLILVQYSQFIDIDLIVTDTNGCISTSQSDAYIEFYQEPNWNLNFPDTVCVGDTVVFNENTYYPYWDVPPSNVLLFGDGLLYNYIGWNNGNLIEHVYTQSGTFYPNILSNTICNQYVFPSASPIVVLNCGTISGCTDPLADNYDSTATVDDGSCVYINFQYGCIDSAAVNYNPWATIDDGSCIYSNTSLFCSQSHTENSFGAYQISSLSGQYAAADVVINMGEDFQLTTIKTELWTYPSAGVFENVSIRYYTDNGGLPGTLLATDTTSNISQIFLDTLPSALGGVFYKYQVTFNVASFTFNGQLNSNTSYWIAIGNASTLNSSQNIFWAYNLNGSGNWWDCIDNGTGNWTNPGNDLLHEFVGNCIPIGGVISGCTDPLADNYDSTATVDDGSCIYGCTNFTGTLGSENVNCFGNCNGLSVAYPSSGTPPFVYLWSDGQMSQVANNLCPGAYSVDITDFNGCQATLSVIITEPPPLITTTTKTDVSCFGVCDGTANIIASGGTPPYSYNAPWGNTPFASNLCAGTYEFTVIDYNGCDYTDSITILESSALSATITSTNESSPGACDATANVAPSGGCPPYAYDWSNGWPSPTIAGLCTGTYCVTITDCNGCQYTECVTIDNSTMYGCTDSTAFNYDPAATIDDGSCIAVVLGCTDSSALNYNPNANTNDGTCCYTSSANLQVFTNNQCGIYAQYMGWELEDVNGTVVASGGVNAGETWLDNTYYNYCLPLNDSCNSYNLILYNSLGGYGWYVCGQATALVTNSLGDTLINITNFTFGLSQSYPVVAFSQGCTDPLAINYDPLATCDNGSCCYGTSVNLQVYTNNQCGYYAQYMGWELEHPNGTVVASGGINAAEYWQDNTYYNYCLPINGNCDPFSLVLYDNQSYGWNTCSPATALITSSNGDTILFIEGTGSFSTQASVFIAIDQGCTDPSASNYDPNAACDDGSCLYYFYGCTDPIAVNYDSTATIDDGSCVYCDQSVVDTFNYTGSMQTYVVPSGVTFVTIEAFGAEGGSGGANSVGCITGKGAKMKGDFAVTPGDVISVLVGQKGFTSSLYGGGGGGGSFVVNNTQNQQLLLVAGGGGGVGYFGGCNGLPADTAVDGFQGNNNGGSGGTSGSGGNVVYTNWYGSGGGGYIGDGYDGGDNSTGGLSYLNGASGGLGGITYGANGGYGGGGGSDVCGGGGGGYSGGGGGSNTYGGGGGGGSYNIGVNQENSIGNIGDGLVIISYPLLTCTGCTDPLACNYDSIATIDNGNCVYPTTNIFTAIACDTYTWGINGTSYTTSGIYTDVSTDSIGCTHTEILYLTIVVSTFDVDTITACDSYTWLGPLGDGNTYTTSGVYTHMSTNPAGCDHTQLLYLTINNSTGSTTTISSCDQYLWNGQYITTSGIYTDVSTNSTGCLHVDTLDLTIITFSTSDTTIITACDSYTWSWPFGDGNTYVVSGSFTHEYPNALGCLDTAVLFLTINNSTSNIYNDTACDSYTWSLNGVTYDTSGIYTYTSTNFSGCIDTAFLYLTINNSTSNVNTILACDSYTWLGPLGDGNTYSTSGVYTHSSTNNTGCTHIETLVLIIDTVSTSTTTAISCDEYLWNDSLYTVSGVYTHIIPTVSGGCDSTAILNLTINNSVSVSSSQSICDGQSITIGANTYTTAGTYVDTLVTVDGCDSIVTTILTIDPVGCIDLLAYNYDSTAVCDDGSCLYCDLDVSLFITQNSPLSCDGFVLANVSTSNGPVTYIWSDSSGIISTINNAVNLCEGIYTLTVSDLVGCTFDTTFVLGNPVLLGCTDPTASNYNPNATVDDGSCSYLCDFSVVGIGNDNGCGGNAYVEVIASGGTPPYTYAWLDSNQQIYSYYASIDSINISETTTFTCLASDANGCDTLISITVVLVCGCTDSLATNYDPLATSDDGSCIYSSVCPELPITGMFIDGILDDRVNANFDNMNTYDASGNQVCRVDQIRIQYRPVGTNAWQAKNIASPTGYNNGVCNSTQSTMKPIRNLTLATEYEWRVKVWYCSGGNGGWVNGANFTTAGECPNVGNLTAYGSLPTRATFDWDNSNGPYEFARIKMRIDTLSNPSPSDWLTVGGTGVPYGTYTKNKNGLTPGQTYRAQARTWCDPNGGAYNSLSWTPLVTWTQPTNRIDGGEAISNLDIYPNPSRDIFNITFTSEQVQDLRVRVLSVVGEEIILEDLQQFVGEYTKQIDLKDNAKGIYFLEIETNNGVINKKLILQ